MVLMNLHHLTGLGLRTRRLNYRSTPWRGVLDERHLPDFPPEGIVVHAPVRRGLGVRPELGAGKEVQLALVEPAGDDCVTAWSTICDSLGA